MGGESESGSVLVVAAEVATIQEGGIAQAMTTLVPVLMQVPPQPVMVASVPQATS